MDESLKFLMKVLGVLFFGFVLFLIVGNIVEGDYEKCLKYTKQNERHVCVEKRKSDYKAIEETIKDTLEFFLQTANKI